MVIVLLVLLVKTAVGGPASGSQYALRLVVSTVCDEPLATVATPANWSRSNGQGPLLITLESDGAEAYVTGDHVSDHPENAEEVQCYSGRDDGGHLPYEEATVSYDADAQRFDVTGYQQDDSNLDPLGR